MDNRSRENIRASTASQSESFQCKSCTSKRVQSEFRFIKYVSTILHHNSRNYDRKYRRNRLRTLLLLDKPINVTGGTALVETLVDHRADIEKSTLGDLRDLEGLISNPTLHGAYMSLSEKQKRILNLYYVMELNDTQIAKKLKLSQQSVSKTRKQAISNIKKVYLDRMQHQKLE